MSTIKTTKSGITYTKRKTRSKTVKFEKTPKKSEGKRTGYERSNTLEQGSDITSSFDLSHDGISKDDWKTQSMTHEDVEKSFDSISFDMAKSFELENGYAFEGRKESENPHKEKYEENEKSPENTIQERPEDENQQKEEVKENPIIPLEKVDNSKIEIKEEPKLKPKEENKNKSETKSKEEKSSKVIYGVAIGALALLGIGIFYIRNKK